MAIATKVFQKKIPNREGGRVEDTWKLEFLWGILKKYNVEIPGVNFTIKLAFPGVINKKVLVLGPCGSSIQTIGFFLNTILWNFQGVAREASFCLELPRIK